MNASKRAISTQKGGKIRKNKVVRGRVGKEVRRKSVDV